LTPVSAVDENDAMLRLRRSLALVIATSVLLPLPASAQHKSDRERSALARQAFDDGKKAYNVGEFEKAIDLWKQAYEYRDDPIFLYNIAQAYRQKGDPPKAIFFYRAYLRESPRAKNRADVEARITELQKLIDAQPPPEPPKPEPEPPPPPPVVVTPAPLPPPVDEPVVSAHPGQPLVIGGLVTGGVGVAALATGVVFFLKSRSIASDLEQQNRDGVPWTQALRDKESEGKRDSTLGAVGIAVGTAAVLTGATLVWLGARKNAAAHAAELSWRLSPDGVSVGVGLTF